MKPENQPLRELLKVVDKYNLRFFVLSDGTLDLDWEFGEETYETNFYRGEMRTGCLRFKLECLEE